MAAGVTTASTGRRAPWWARHLPPAPPRGACAHMSGVWTARRRRPWRASRPVQPLTWIYTCPRSQRGGLVGNAWILRGRGRHSVRVTARGWQHVVARRHAPLARGAVRTWVLGDGCAVRSSAHLANCATARGLLHRSGMIATVLSLRPAYSSFAARSSISSAVRWSESHARRRHAAQQALAGHSLSPEFVRSLASRVSNYSGERGRWWVRHARGAVGTEGANRAGARDSTELAIG